jgi:hypothetical protein
VHLDIHQLQEDHQNRPTENSRYPQTPANNEGRYTLSSHHVTSHELMGSQKDVVQSFTHYIVGNFVQDRHTTITSRDYLKEFNSCQNFRNRPYAIIYVRFSKPRAQNNNIIIVLIYTARIGLKSPFTPPVGYYYYYGQILKLY